MKAASVVDNNIMFMAARRLKNGKGVCVCLYIYTYKHIIHIYTYIHTYINDNFKYLKY